MYLKNAPEKVLLFSKSDALNILGYTNYNWAGDQTNKRSTCRYFTFVGENLVTWRSKKHKIVQRSSAKAEF